MKWETHIKSIENTISRHIGIMQRAKFLLGPSHLLLLYNAFVLPHLKYSCETWALNYPSKLSRICTLQKRAIRIVDQAHYLQHSSPIFKKHKVLKFPDLIKMSQRSTLLLDFTFESPIGYRVSPADQIGTTFS